MSDLVKLAERCEQAADHALHYALSPPQGYGGQAAAERRAALEWMQIAECLRGRAERADA